MACPRPPPSGAAPTDTGVPSHPSPDRTLCVACEPACPGPKIVQTSPVTGACELRRLPSTCESRAPGLPSLEAQGARLGLWEVFPGGSGFGSGGETARTHHGGASSARPLRCSQSRCCPGEQRDLHRSAARHRRPDLDDQVGTRRRQPRARIVDVLACERIALGQPVAQCALQGVGRTRSEAELCMRPLQSDAWSHD
eukprot:15471391-Alexandrium_andersonii.AAC.3